MAVITEPTTFERQAAEPPSPATIQTAPPVDLRSDLAWLLAQAYLSTPLFA